MKIEDVQHDLLSVHTRLAQTHDQGMQEIHRIGDLEHRFQEMFENFPLPMYYFDLWGRFLWRNKNAEEVCGYKCDEVIGLPYYKTKLFTIDASCKSFEDLLEQPI